MARHFAYIRRSRSSQQISPERQRADIGDWATKQNVKIDRWFIEEPITGSSTIAQRRELTQLLNELGKKDTLVCLDLTRLARSQAVFSMVVGILHTKGANLAFADGSTYESDDMFSRLIGSVMSFAAELERVQIGQRTKSALAVIKNTHALGAPKRQRYGYTNSCGLLRPDPAEQRIGKLVLSLRNSGKTFREIVGEFESDGIVNRAGGKFSIAGLSRMAKTFHPCPDGQATT